MKTKILCQLFVFALLVSSCATISYTPKVSLDVSPTTIRKTVKVENLVDKISQEQKAKPVSGYSVTDSESLAGDLSSEVTNAIIEDFNSNAVFSKISKKEDQPDLILKGEIVSFEGKFRPTTAMWITIPIDLIWFLGVPVFKDIVNVEIKLSIYNKSGMLIGEYSGKSSDTKLYTIYKNAALGLPAKTNKYFSEAIKQIREKILLDINKFN